MLKAFVSEGFFALRQAVPDSFLSRLQQLTQECILREDDPDCPAHYLDNTRCVSCLENIANNGNLSALELLGSPLVLDIAASICGPDFFPMQDFVVVKMLGDPHATVGWHQDMLHNRTGIHNKYAYPFIESGQTVLHTETSGSVSYDKIAKNRAVNGIRKYVSATIAGSL